MRTRGPRECRRPGAAAQRGFQGTGPSSARLADPSLVRGGEGRRPQFMEGVSEPKQLPPPRLP